MRITFISVWIMLIAFACKPKTQITVPDKENKKHIEVVSHWGANRLAPENTMAAFIRAIEEGADYIEIDVATSKDSMLYCLHDRTLDRTTDGTGELAQQTSEYIDKLDAGSWFSKDYCNERVPRVKDILRAVKGKSKVYFDVKDADLKSLILLVEEERFENDCFFWFDKYEKAQLFRQLTPDLALKVNASDVYELEQAVDNLNPQIIECDMYRITPEFLATCRGHNMKLMANILRDTWKEYRNAINLGVDMVDTDHPDYFRHMEENPGIEFTDYRLVAHRGGIVEDVFDEFDPRSIQAAIDSGYWMLEMDVRPTADKKIVLHHDSNLQRIYGIDKKPEDMTLADLKQLKALNGGYAPVSFEEAAALCQGKIKFMIDVKPSTAEPWFYDELKRILQEYNMLDDAFYIRNDVEPFIHSGHFGFRMTELPGMMKRLQNGEDIASKYYLFDHGNRINAETARWCQYHHIEVCASVNKGHYKGEFHGIGAKRDIEYLQQCGVTVFQIDSEYDTYFKKKRL